jgi:hypothetical protein
LFGFWSFSHSRVNAHYDVSPEPGVLGLLQAGVHVRDIVDAEPRPAQVPTCPRCGCAWHGLGCQRPGCYCPTAWQEPDH